jgi:NADH:ubiquinone oxidoreductase subunit 2 (subunit N)
MLMTIGSFAIVTVLGREGDRDHDLARYRGLAGRQPALALAFAVLLLAQAGAPFTTGLWAKVEVVFASIQAGYVPLAAIAMVTAAVAAYFYLRVAVLMYAAGGVGEPEAGLAPGDGAHGAEGADGADVRATDEPVAPAPAPVEPDPVRASGNGSPLTGDGAAWASPAATSNAVSTLNEQILLADEEPEGAETLPEAVPVPVLSGVAIWVCVGVTVLFGVWPQPLIDFANHATLLFLAK